jgi:hypothetical protein
MSCDIFCPNLKRKITFFYTKAIKKLVFKKIKMSRHSEGGRGGGGGGEVKNKSKKEN